MRGLAMYGDDGLGAFKMTADDLKDSLMAGGAGAVGILATSYILNKLPADMVADPVNNSRLKSVIGLAIGVLGGRALDSYASRDAAMGFTGAVAGASLASLIASWAPDTLTTSLSGGLADADLAMLEATVATNSGAWRAPELAAPDVATQQLMGLGRGFRGTETSDETIAAYNVLMGAQDNAPPPSF
jgi:hypothetical protein